MVLHADMIGELVDAFLADHGRIHVGQKKFLAPRRDRLHDNVDRQVAARRLQAAISRLLLVARRSSLRLMVRIVVNIGEGAALEMAQTENLSETGMLVRTDESYPLGSRLTFEFHMGGDRLPIRGEGTVMRRTTPGRESVRGIGVRFASFERDGAVRLQRYLRELSR